jgi:hypothetical protein
MACVIAALASLALLSVQFDFGHSVYPSREFPYFSSGRLIAGALVPFAILVVYGIGRLLPRRTRGLPLLALAAIIAFVTASEIVVNRAVFRSEHNWFHR